MHGRIEKFIHNFCQKTQRKKRHNINMNFRETGCEDVEWTEWAQNAVQCRAFVNTVEFMVT